MQSVLGLLVNGGVPMDTYMTRDRCDNELLPIVNMFFIKCPLLFEIKGL
jgi:hypothetical protein